MTKKYDCLTMQSVDYYWLKLCLLLPKSYLQLLNILFTICSCRRRDVHLTYCL